MRLPSIFSLFFFASHVSRVLLGVCMCSASIHPRGNTYMAITRAIINEKEKVVGCLASLSVFRFVLTIDQKHCSNRSCGRMSLALALERHPS